MKINRYSIISLLKFTFTFCIVFSMVSSKPVQADADISPKNPSETNTEATGDSTRNDDQTEAEENDIDSSSPSSEDKIKAVDNTENTDTSQENTASQEIITIKNALLIFAIVDLPIFALLLGLWFLNNKQRKQELKELSKKHNVIVQKLDRLHEINSKLSNLDTIKREIINQVQENNQKLTDYKIEILETLHKNQTHQPANSHKDIDSYSNNHYPFPTSTTEQAEHQLDIANHNTVAIADPIPHFVDKYNQDKQSLSHETVAKVSATEASLNKRRMGDESKLMLENTIQKRYLIIQEDGDYFLVPHAKIKINEHNKSSLEALFECVSFIPEYTDFHLIKPAKVSQVEPELWQLDNRGKIEFS